MIALINLVLSAIVLWGASCSIDRMTANTKFYIRLAYIFMAVGAFGSLLSPFFKPEIIHSFTISDTVIMAAIAIMVVLDPRRSMFRRKRAIQ